jgi:hypothetical protein
MNEKSEKQFQSSRGSSNIDFKISNNTLVNYVQERKTSEENCSDHKIIQFCIRQQTGNNFLGVKYITRTSTNLRHH